VQRTTDAVESHKQSASTPLVVSGVTARQDTSDLDRAVKVFEFVSTGFR